MKRALLLLALFLNISLAAAETPQPMAQPQPALQTCPTDVHKLDLAATQSDCCKGHKGVCGCRAGKIVCCDNSKSDTCTCHADEGVGL